MLSLADAIIQQDRRSVQQLLRYADINELDEYGFRPLIEAAIVNNIPISELLLNQGAAPNLQDLTGGTALHWAAENNNGELCLLLLDHGANPNAFNFAGQPVLVMPMLRQYRPIKQLLIRAGADELFAQDYINTKLLGHIFELIGTVNIVSPDNQFVEVDCEGFFLEITLGLISDSLSQFQNHFAARHLRRYSGLTQFIVQVLYRASLLAKYQQYQVDVSKFQLQINELIQQEPLIIPVGYEGHAITFIRYGEIWIKCDRREDSRLYDNIMFYRVHHMENLTPELIKDLMYEKQTSEFINVELHHMLGLEAITDLKIEAQISGNCSWANVEATIPSLFFLILMQMNQDIDSMAHYKTLALNLFHHWREWNKDRALDFCIQSYEQGDVLRKACKAEILATILFQRCQSEDAADRARTETILDVLTKSPYEYLLKKYLRVYYYDNPSPEGKNFSERLKEYGYLK